METPPLRRRGLALILAVGVLGVLAVLGSAFAVLSRLERRAAGQRVLGTQALLLARSGLEDALARLEGGQDPDALTSRYGGEDWDLSGGALSAMEAANEVYRPGAPDREGCPVRHAMRPSFFTRIASGNPAAVTVDGKLRGASGRLASGPYALRIQAGGFHLNGGDPTADPSLGYNAQLRRMFWVLADGIDREDGMADGQPVSPADGLKLTDARPRTARGWESIEQVRDLAFSSDPPATRRIKMDALMPYLVLDTWVDRKVLKPTAVPVPEYTPVYAWTEMVLGRSDAQPGFSGGRTSVIPPFEARAPVPLAWVRSHKPAALALTNGLKCQVMDDAGAGSTSYGNRIGRFLTSVISSSEAAQLANRLATWTTDLDRWQRFSEFCDSVTGLTGTTNVLQAKRDMLKANCNPNSDLNKFNPDPPLAKVIDKTDLLAYSTELSLFPSSGWRIEAAGRVLSPNGRTLASRSLDARRNVSAFRITTQREFVCENLGRLDVAGDETSVRLPGRLGPPFLSASRGTSPTWGHRLGLPGLGTAGAGLQTYPEPCVNDGSGLFQRPADYDGCLQLATVETRSDDCYGVATDTRDMKLLASFTSGWDLDLADAYPVNPDGRKVFPDSKQVTTAELTKSLLDAAKPNTLHPDGCYSEANRIPGYLDRGNAHPFHGLLSFWFKPNYNLTARGANGYLRGHILIDRVNWGGLDPMIFLVGHAIVGTVPNLGTIFEIDHAPGNDVLNPSGVPIEHCFLSQQAKTIHRWALVSFSWDSEAWWNPSEPTNHRNGQLVVNNGVLSGDCVINDGYGSSVLSLPASDPTVDAPELGGSGSVRPHKMFLGKREYASTADESRYTWTVGTGCEATLDEVAIYDFGAGQESVTLDYARNRFLDGRYYRGSEYTSLTATPVNDQAASWFSGPIRLPAGSVLRHVLWTWLLPNTTWKWWSGPPNANRASLPNDYPEIELTRASSLAPAYLDSEARSRSTRSAGFTPLRQDWRTDLPVRETFRVHAVFRRPVPLANDAPLIDSPVLDDLTFIYDAPSLPRLRDFRTGE